MAVVITSGLLDGTVVTLFTVSVMYEITTKRKKTVSCEESLPPSSKDSIFLNPTEENFDNQVKGEKKTYFLFVF